MKLPGSLLFAAIAAASCALSGTAAAIIVTEGMVEKMSAEEFERMKQNVPYKVTGPEKDFVECVAYNLIAQIEGPQGQIRWEVILFEDEDINAFAMAGGKIGVNYGISRVATNEDALAAVIGHEIAHVLEKHVVNRLNRQNITSLASLAAAIATAMAGPGTYAANAAANAAGEGAALLTELGLNRPFDRGQESEADIVGLQLMARAGFDPRATIDLWRNMALANRGDPPEFLSTHPSSRTRLNDLAAELPAAIEEYEKAIQAGRRPNCGP